MKFKEFVYCFLLSVIMTVLSAFIPFKSELWGTCSDLGRVGILTYGIVSEKCKIAVDQMGFPLTIINTPSIKPPYPGEAGLHLDKKDASLNVVSILMNLLFWFAAGVLLYIGFVLIRKRFGGQRNKARS